MSVASLVPNIIKHSTQNNLNMTPQVAGKYGMVDIQYAEDRPEVEASTVPSKLDPRARPAPTVNMKA